MAYLALRLDSVAHCIPAAVYRVVRCVYLRHSTIWVVLNTTGDSSEPAGSREVRGAQRHAGNPQIRDTSYYTRIV